MKKKKAKESPKEQAERFAKSVQDMIDGGELNPTKADEEFDSAITRVLPRADD